MVAGNWKMNGTRESANRLVADILAGLPAAIPLDVVVCPPVILISRVADLLDDAAAVHWGGQTVDTHRNGAYTGETSAEMLRDHGCRYVIVGHSERRTLYGETDDVIAEKFAVAVETGITPILCIGEQLAERDTGTTEAVIGRQIDAVLARVGIDGFNGAVVAYEPVWAIGSGRTATPDQAQHVHRFVREKLAARAAAVAEGLRIIYGGSVTKDNAAGLFAQPDIDGGLIGGASLRADDFLAICQAAHSHRSQGAGRDAS